MSRNLIEDLQAALEELESLRAERETIRTVMASLARTLGVGKATGDGRMSASLSDILKAAESMALRLSLVR